MVLFELERRILLRPFAAASGATSPFTSWRPASVPVLADFRMLSCFLGEGPGKRVAVKTDPQMWERCVEKKSAASLQKGLP